MDDMVTNDLMEFFETLAQLGNCYWGFAFRWSIDANGVRLPVCIFCEA